MVPAAQIFTVNALTDTGAGNGNTGDLRYCITQAEQAANAGSTITFQNGLSGTITLGNNPLPTISQNTTITGPGGSVITVQGTASAQNPYSIFTIGNGISAGISGLAITGGYATNGGGIYNSGNLTVQNDVIQNNIATQSGGGIANYGSVTSQDDLIQINTAGGYGGGIYNALYSLWYLYGDNIQNNGALVAGGGIANFGELDSVTGGAQIQNNTVTQSGGKGGGIYNRGAVGFHAYVAIAGNVVDTALGDGGGVYNGLNGSFTMDGGVIGGNSAAYGGGLYNGATATLDDGLVVQQNTAYLYGGGLYLNALSTTNFNGVTVQNNILAPGAVAGKGVYYQTGATLNNLAGLTDNDDPGGQPVQGN